jgi:CheY-like chemotaxis protein
MSHLENPGRILVVDDNVQLLAGISRNLRRVIPVVTASSGDEALTLLKKDRDFSIILSDMRMPGMDGAQFFSEAKLLAPDAVRILLTGQADLAAVIAAINHGRIYRFLSKPVDFDDLRNVVGAAMAHYRLQQEERRKHEATQRAEIDRIEDLLALASVPAWGRAARTRYIAHALAEHLGLTDIVSIERAAVLDAARLALPTMPDDARAAAVLSLAGANDPEDPVRVMLSEVSATREQPLRVGSRVLQVSLAVSEALGAWHDRVDGLARQGLIDDRFATALRAIHERLVPSGLVDVAVDALKQSTRLATDACDASGRVVAPQAARVTPVLRALLAAAGVTGQVKVFADADSANVVAASA